MQGLTKIREGIQCLQDTATASVTDDELVEAMTQFHQLQSMLAAQHTRFLDTLDVRKLWRTDGSKALWAWLARKANASPTAAKAIAGLAKRLRVAPKTKTAFEHGDIDRDRAVELCRRATSPRPPIADSFPHAEADLVDHAKTLSFADLCRVLRYWDAVVDEDGEHDQAASDYLSRNLHASEFLRGMVRIDGTLDPLGGGIVGTELKRLEREMFHQDWALAKQEHGEGTRTEHLWRTPAQRRADALQEMARRSACYTGRSDTDGNPRPLIVIHCGHATIARMCELASGTVIAPGVIIPHLHHADVERIIHGPDKRVIELSSRARFFRGGLRRAIELSQPRCAHPTCDEPAENCHIDHITPHSHGGETTQTNARPGCDTHNWWWWNHQQRHSGPDPPDTG